jgi:hypothetical protein
MVVIEEEENDDDDDDDEANANQDTFLEEFDEPAGGQGCTGLDQRRDPTFYFDQLD